MTDSDGPAVYIRTVMWRRRPSASTQRAAGVGGVAAAAGSRAANAQLAFRAPCLPSQHPDTRAASWRELIRSLLFPYYLLSPVSSASFSLTSGLGTKPFNTALMSSPATETVLPILNTCSSEVGQSQSCALLWRLPPRPQHSEKVHKSSN